MSKAASTAILLFAPVLTLSRQEYVIHAETEIVWLGMEMLS